MSVRQAVRKHGKFFGNIVLGSLHSLAVFLELLSSHFVAPALASQHQSIVVLLSVLPSGETQSWTVHSPTLFRILNLDFPSAKLTRITVLSPICFTTDLCQMHSLAQRSELIPRPNQSS